MLAALRSVQRAAVRLDRADLPLLARLPSGFKRRAFQSVLRLAGRLLPAVVPVGGVRLAAPRSHQIGYVLKPHEPEIVALLRRYLERGDTAVDVGANIGYLTLEMAHCVGSSGRVWSVEPAPGNLTWLLRNLSENGADQVRVLATAAGSSWRPRCLDLSTGSTRHSIYGGSPGGSRSLHVAEVPLDEIVEGAVHLVKIDVEGAELEVLRGMERILTENPAIKVIVELNPERLAAAGESDEALLHHLTSRGFELHRIGAGGQLLPLEGHVDGSHVNLLAHRPIAG